MVVRPPLHQLNALQSWKQGRLGNINGDNRTPERTPEVGLLEISSLDAPNLVRPTLNLVTMITSAFARIASGGDRQPGSS